MLHCYSKDSEICKQSKNNLYVGNICDNVRLLEWEMIDRNLMMHRLHTLL